MKECIKAHNIMLGRYTENCGVTFHALGEVQRFMFDIITQLC
jgi:hypothetical protein